MQAPNYIVEHTFEGFKSFKNLSEKQFLAKFTLCKHPLNTFSKEALMELYAQLGVEEVAMSASHLCESWEELDDKRLIEFYGNPMDVKEFENEADYLKHLVSELKTSLCYVFPFAIKRNGVTKRHWLVSQWA